MVRRRGKVEHHQHEGDGLKRDEMRVLSGSEVTKMVKIHIRRMRILTFKICRMRMEAFIFLVRRNALV